MDPKLVEHAAAKYAQGARDRDRLFYHPCKVQTEKKGGGKHVLSAITAAQLDAAVAKSLAVAGKRVAGLVGSGAGGVAAPVEAEVGSARGYKVGLLAIDIAGTMPLDMLTPNLEALRAFFKPEVTVVKCIKLKQLGMAVLNGAALVNPPSVPAAQASPSKLEDEVKLLRQQLAEAEEEIRAARLRLRST